MKLTFLPAPFLPKALMFRSPHLIVMFTGITALVLICTKFVGTDPCPVGIMHLTGRTVIIVLIWVGGCSSESTERRVRLQLCVLVPTLVGHRPLIK